MTTKNKLIVVFSKDGFEKDEVVFSKTISE